MNADPKVCVSCGDIFDGEEALWWRWRKDCCSQHCSDQQDADDKAPFGIHDALPGAPETCDTGGCGECVQCVEDARNLAACEELYEPDHVVDEDDDAFLDNEPRENFSKCDCKYCFCQQETEYGAKCSDCLAGAHQG